MISVMVAEDEPHFRKELVEYLSAQEGIEVCHATSSSDEFLEALDIIKPELVILDIHMPGKSGIEAARIVRRRFPHTEIIFITSHEEYIREAVDLYAADYISKPLDKGRLARTVQRIKQKSLLSGKQVVLKVLKIEGNFHMIQQSNIYFVEALKKKAIVYTAEKKLAADHSLKELKELLDNKIFFQTSRSYLVNLTKIASIKKDCTKTSMVITFKDINDKAYLSKKLISKFRNNFKKVFPGEIL